MNPLAIFHSPLEQLDLLVNHLGQESRSQAENIRASNPNNPDRAVNQIWERLDRQYGSPETIEFALKQRIHNFPNLTEGDRKRYYDLSDLAAEVESVKSDCAFGPAFAYYDTVSGLNEFVRKLPKRLREKWAVECDSFKVKNNMFHAPFMFFAQFLRNLARLKNEPSFVFDNVPVSASQSSSSSNQRPSNKANRFIGVSNKKTEVIYSSKTDSSNTRCPIHGTNLNHTLKDCNKFRDKSLKERKDYLFKNGYCLRCCGQKRHIRKNCKETVKCDICSSSEHISLLHPDPDPRKKQEGEQIGEIEASCTQVCKTPQSTSKSCAKMVLVSVYPIKQPLLSCKVYCMIDDQSNKSLATSAFFNSFEEYGPDHEYVMSSCAGKFVTSGPKASGYAVKSLDESCTFELPCLIECNDIPNSRSEIPSPAVAQAYSHLNDLATCIPEVDDSAEIEILIGRDLISAHYSLDQRIGGDSLPFGQCVVISLTLTMYTLSYINKCHFFLIIFYSQIIFLI